MVGQAQRLAHKSAPYISIANLIALLVLLVTILFPSVRIALGLTLRADDQHASVVERVSTNEADIRNLKANATRLDHEIQQLAVRNNDQYQTLNDKLDGLTRLLLKRRFPRVVQP